MPASEAVEIFVDEEVNNGLSPDMEARKRLCLALSSSCLRSLSEGLSRSLFSRSASAVVSLLPVGAPPFFILATAQQHGVSIASDTASQRKGTVQVPCRAHTLVQGHHRSLCTPRKDTRGSLQRSATHWTPISHFFSLPSRVSAQRSRQRRRHAPDTLLAFSRNLGAGRVVAAHLAPVGHLVNLVEPRRPT